MISHSPSVTSGRDTQTAAPRTMRCSKGRVMCPAQAPRVDWIRFLGGITTSPYVLLCAAFTTFAGVLIFMFLRLPALPLEQREHLKFPKNVEDLKYLGSVLADYQDNYYWEILLVIIAAYIFLQSFMIPGSAFISILLGYLFPFPVALVIISLCSAVGATCCYLLVGFIGSKILLHLIPKKIEECRLLIQRYRHTMFFCMCLLRICPLIPNWLVNVSSPIVEIPVLDFFWGTFVGVVPLSLVFVKAGTVLQELTDMGVTSLASFSTLLALAVISLLPFLFRRQIGRWFS